MDIALALTLAFLPRPLAAESALQELRGSASQSGAEASPAPAIQAQSVAAGGRAEGIGLSHSGNPFDIPDFSLQEIARMLKDAGGTHYRPHCPLNEAVPEVSAETLAKLRQAASDPALLDAMTDELSRGGRWERMDALVNTFSGSGIQVALVVGAGYRKEAPLYTLPDGTQDRVSPDRLGRDTYIALVRWLAGAAARRYGDRVAVWQVENEINIAGMVSGIGWRVNEKSWSDRDFLLGLVSALARTVHEEGRRQGRSLKTTHNFATDNTVWKDWVGPLNAAPVDLGKDIGALGSDVLDIVGVDLYANYFTGWPIQDEKVGRVVSQAAAAAGGRPVWVLETGFPRAPVLRGFGEGRQAEYFQKTFDAAYGAGASVVLAFGWFWNPHGWYTDNPKPLPWWNPQAGEQYWSPIRVTRRPDGSKDVRLGPAWDEFKSAARRWTGK